MSEPSEAMNSHKLSLDSAMLKQQQKRLKQTSDQSGEVLIPVKRQLDVIQENDRLINRGGADVTGTTPASRTARRPKPVAPA